jgi:hypothetical protein
MTCGRWRFSCVLVASNGTCALRLSAVGVLVASNGTCALRLSAVGVLVASNGTCALRLSVLELGRSVVRYVNDAGSEIHLSPTDLASPLPTQVELE